MMRELNNPHKVLDPTPETSESSHSVCSPPILQIRNLSPQEILLKVTRLKSKPQGEYVNHSAVLPCLVHCWLD